jgi:hypothetical protein
VAKLFKLKATIFDTIRNGLLPKGQLVKNISQSLFVMYGLTFCKLAFSPSIAFFKNELKNCLKLVDLKSVVTFTLT